MSDTVSINSCTSSGYASETYENTSELDYKTNKKFLTHNSKKYFKSGNAYDRKHLSNRKNSPQFFDRHVSKKATNSKTESGRNINCSLGVYKPSRFKSNQYKNTYHYHDGKLTPNISERSENQNIKTTNEVPPKMSKTDSRDLHMAYSMTRIDCAMAIPNRKTYNNKISQNNTEDVLTVEMLLRNTKFKDNNKEYTEENL